MSNYYMTDVTVTERLNYNDAYETLMNSSDVKDTLAELRLCLFAHKLAQPSTSIIITLFFKILSTMTAKGSDGMRDWFSFIEVNEENYMFGASNTRLALMFDKYYSKKEACKILGISLYVYNLKYAKLLENKQNLLEVMKGFTPYYDLKKSLGVGIVIDFLDHFNYLPVEKGFLASEHGFIYMEEERQLELEFSIICRNLTDALGNSTAYYFIMNLLKNYGINYDTIDRMWRGLPYIEIKLPKTPYCKSLYTDDLIAYGKARGLTKADTCRYLLRRPQNYIRSPFIRKKFKEIDWDNYLCRTTLDWSTLSKNDVYNFIDVFRKVAEFING